MNLDKNTVMTQPVNEILKQEIINRANFMTLQSDKILAVFT
ncbi:MAG: hypothetical protein SAL70_01410 [Scytonema sp. PMC 1070.18]|nr:hypothetical protein [Scytonema sp. PMC 1070.18]